MSHFVETGIDVLSAVAENLNRYKICIEWFIVNYNTYANQCQFGYEVKFLLGWIKISVSKLASIFWKMKKDEATKVWILKEVTSVLYK